MSATTLPDFRSRDFLLGHVQHTMRSTTLVPSILEENFTTTSKTTVPSMTPLRVTWSAVRGLCLPIRWPIKTLTGRSIELRSEFAGAYLEGEQCNKVSISND